ncbi:hypothetical protein [Streptomyces aidingensis]|uniref:Ig-like domain-containing protein n=1 Tax=Streptomyces aidingensis TaxID=910347 RepID=A0A1I1GYG2_9ACTN|nr:hypothetical protein [Streptomyces aidingensis]SFC16847.1 hypothetical protein SAMN05421773_102185 [Streptomyces aidingensis]
MTRPPEDPRTGAAWRGLGKDADGDGDEATVRLPGGSTDGAPTAGPADEDAEDYSATELDGSWDNGGGGGAAPAGAPLPGDRQPTALAPGPGPQGTAPTLRDPDPDPDPGGDGVLRFGPGVPAAQPPAGAAAAGIWRGEAPPAPPPRRRRLLRRYGLAVAVLIGVAAFLLWDRSGPALEITAVTARTDATFACDSTADVVGVVRTNGRPGTLTYQWTRSDGTSSGVLKEQVTRGQTEALLHLLWTFRGEGTVAATAQLRITGPSTHTASVSFTYTCP